MSNLSAERYIKKVGAEMPAVIQIGVDGGASKIWEGAMVSALTATGLAVRAGTASSGPVRGVAEHTVDNSAGADGVASINLLQGAFWFGNSGGGDACTEATFGLPVYAVDDQTVADNSSSGTRKLAGLCLQVDSTDGVLVLINAALNSMLEDASFADGISVDTISELTAAAGVTIDGVLLKDSKVTASLGVDAGASVGVITDLISEKTSATGVTADGVLLKDAKVTASGGADLGASPGALVDIISEKTGAAGVTIDGLLVKDAGLPGFMPGISIMQVAGGTFASGTATINTGITVTANTDAFVVMSAVVTGSANVGCFAHLKASNVVGGAGVGAVTLNILGDDGAVDADAAGAFRVLLIN